MSGAGTGDFIGRGWKFPVKVDGLGRMSWSDGADRIRAAIWIVLSTAQGERVMRPSFGAGVHSFVFASNSPATRTLLAAKIKEAVTRWEPRINLVRVDVQAGDEPSLANVSIDYTIASTNELFNLVFPFYVQEGVG